MFTAVATTLWTTVLISYRIYSLSNYGIQIRSKHHFNNILQIVLQSSFFYSLALVATAVVLVIPNTESDLLPRFQAGSYIFAIAFALTVFVYIMHILPAIHAHDN